jgi:predicted dehydrogenase
VSRDDLDVIVVSSPTVLHAPMAIEALAAGKHVLCEKPMAPDLPTARAMYQAAVKSGRAHAVCFETRWTRERHAVWSLVESGGIGTPYLTRISEARTAWRSLEWDMRPPTRAEYFYRKDLGGGCLNQVAVHSVDFLVALFGVPKRVSGRLRTTIGYRTGPGGERFIVDGDDTAVALLEFAGGGLGIVTVCGIAAHETGYTFEALGSTGTVMIGARPTGPRESVWPEAGVEVFFGTEDDSQVRPIDLGEDQGAAVAPERSSSSVLVAAESRMLTDWLPALSGEVTRVPTFLDGLTVQSVIDAIHQSADSDGSWIEVAEVTAQ